MRGDVEVPPGREVDQFPSLDRTGGVCGGFVRVEVRNAPETGTINAIYYFTALDSVRQLAHFPAHREAKDQVQRWYHGYRIIVSEVKTTYGDVRLPEPR